MRKKIVKHYSAYKNVYLGAPRLRDSDPRKEIEVKVLNKQGNLIRIEIVTPDGRIVRIVIP